MGTQTIRNYKSGVFAEFFQEKSRLIELYNAVSNTNYAPDVDIEINTLKNALFMGVLNDISFVLNDTLIILMEHQSTICQNMPLRFLLYVNQISEVYNMLNAEITLEDVLAMRYEEGHEDGMEKGARRLAELIQEGYSVDDALKLISSEKETRNQ